jgi:crossover junction endodeoxyribonuclease RuvC
VRILGLDPGLRITGWGVIDARGNHLTYVAHGVIKSDASGDLATRLVQLHDGLSGILDAWQPGAAAVEQTFVNKNPDSTLKLGQARGVILLVPALRGVPVAEYAPNHIKKAVVGVGHAAKEQVHMMVARLLPGVKDVTADAADALAIAICHAHHAQTKRVMVAAA